MKTEQDYLNFVETMNVGNDVKKVMIKQVKLHDRGLLFLLNAKMK